MARYSLCLLMLLFSCAATPVPSAETSATGTDGSGGSGSQSRNGTGSSGSTGSGSGSGRKASLKPVTPPFDLETALEEAFRKCENNYLAELKNRWIQNPAVTRVLPYETVEDREARQIEYRLILRSNFVYVDNISSTALVGKYVREISRCTVTYDEASKVLKAASTIGIEEASKAREDAQVDAKQTEANSGT
ncbi:MAG: hypothetical protein ACAI44_10565 [Candidatus Sericytochromatia bacterium]